MDSWPNYKLIPWFNRDGSVWDTEQQREVRWNNIYGVSYDTNDLIGGESSVALLDVREMWLCHPNLVPTKNVLSEESWLLKRQTLPYVEITPGINPSYLLDEFAQERVAWSRERRHLDSVIEHVHFLIQELGLVQRNDFI